MKVLPHAHCIFYLDKASKVKLSEYEFEDIKISTGIHSKSGPELLEVVLKHAMHNPCRELNLSAL